MDEARVQAAADLLRHYREMAKASERDLHREIREAITGGVPVTRLARAADLTTARIYQIKAGQ